MEKFSVHRGKVALLDRNNIDTDQIIPKQFLKKIDRIGYGIHLFHDWRFIADGKENPEFSLNQKPYANASILFTGNNFGCGSSREHAVWALAQYGFRVIIAEERESAPAFADIFRNNSMKNGLLTIGLPSRQHQALKEILQKDSPVEMDINLHDQTLTITNPPTKTKIHFQFPESEKNRLLNGLDDIGLTLKYIKDIENFEKSHLL